MKIDIVCMKAGDVVKLKAPNEKERDLVVESRGYQISVGPYQFFLADIVLKKARKLKGFWF